MKAEIVYQLSHFLYKAVKPRKPPRTPANDNYKFSWYFTAGKVCCH